MVLLTHSLTQHADHIQILPIIPVMALIAISPESRVKVQELYLVVTWAEGKARVQG